MSVQVRGGSLQDGVAVLDLLEAVGYYPEPVSFAKTYRKMLADPHFLIRIAEDQGRIVGLATMSLRHQMGLGGLLACLDELAIAPDAPKNTERVLLQLTTAKARAMGARRIVTNKVNEGTSPRPAAAAAAAELAKSA